MFLDAAGTIVLPDRGLVAAALGATGIAIDADDVPSAHFRAVAALDRGPDGDDHSISYVAALCRALGLAAAQLPAACAALNTLADRASSGEILWSEEFPGARRMIDALRAAGIAVLVVTNSDGHAAENLRDSGICQVGAGRGARVDGVIDSAVIGSAKPDPGIFAAALGEAGAEPAATVHVGDRVITDVAGARAAGIAPIHIDPARRCRDRGHRHVRTLSGIWRHISA